MIATINLQLEEWVHCAVSMTYQLEGYPSKNLYIWKDASDVEMTVAIIFAMF